MRASKQAQGKNLTIVQLLKALSVYRTPEETAGETFQAPCHQPSIPVELKVQLLRSIDFELCHVFMSFRLRVVHSISLHLKTLNPKYRSIMM